MAAAETPNAWACPQPLPLSSHLSLNENSFLSFSSSFGSLYSSQVSSTPFPRFPLPLIPFLIRYHTTASTFVFGTCVRAMQSLLSGRRKFLFRSHRRMSYTHSPCQVLPLATSHALLSISPGCNLNLVKGLVLFSFFLAALLLRACRDEDNDG